MTSDKETEGSSFNVAMLNTEQQLERALRLCEYEEARRMEQRLGIKPKIAQVGNTATQAKVWIGYRRANKFFYGHCADKLRTAISLACGLVPVDVYVTKHNLGRTTWLIVATLAELECANDRLTTKHDAVVIKAATMGWAHEIVTMFKTWAYSCGIEYPRLIVRPNDLADIVGVRNPLSLVDHYYLHLIQEIDQ